MQRRRVMKVVSVALTLALAACGRGATRDAGRTASPSASAVASASAGRTQSSSPTQAPVSAQAPVPAESNPPGDIPDNVAFVPYRSRPGGFAISTPEGWARTTSKDQVLFTDKLNTVVVAWQPASKAPTVASAKAVEVPTLRHSELAFRGPSQVKETTLPAGPALFMQYQANSAPASVTGKQYRLDVQRYELFLHGQQTSIILRSPIGSDNVDPWRIITQSFTWR